MNESEIVLKLLSSGQWVLTKTLPMDEMTEEANEQNAWMVTRQVAPFASSSGERVWVGSTPLEAFLNAYQSLDMILLKDLHAIVIKNKIQTSKSKINYFQSVIEEMQNNCTHDELDGVYSTTSNGYGDIYNVRVSCLICGKIKFFDQYQPEYRTWKISKPF